MNQVVSLTVPDSAVRFDAIIDSAFSSAVTNDKHTLDVSIATLRSFHTKASVIDILSALQSGASRAFKVGDLVIVSTGTLDEVQLTRIARVVHAATTWANMTLSLAAPLLIIDVVAQDSSAFAYAYTVFDSLPYFVIRLRADLLDADDFERTMWHELGHCFARCSVRLLDEGWATWVEQQASGELHARPDRADLFEQPFTIKAGLEAMLSPTFTQGVAFEEHIKSPEEVRTLYQRAALLIQKIIDRIGAPRLIPLFEQIQQQPNHTYQLLAEAVAPDMASLDAIFPGDTHCANAATTLEHIASEVMRLRLDEDEMGLRSLSDMLAARLAQNLSPEVALGYLDAVTSLWELDPRLATEAKAQIDSALQACGKCKATPYALALRARIEMMRLSAAENFIVRGIHAANVGKYVASALQQEQDHGEALLCRVWLLVHTPQQFGGNRDLAREILLHMAHRHDQFGQLAKRTIAMLFHDDVVATEEQPVDSAATQTAANCQPITVSPTPQARDTLFVMQGFCFSHSGGFSIDIDELRLGAGERLGLIGPNGAGKSLFLECAVGLNTFSARSHQLFSEEFSTWNAKRSNRSRVGAKLHRLSYDPTYFIRDIVSLSKAAYGRIEQALFDQLGIDELMNKRYGWLSTGQKQRVDLAMAMQPAAELIFLDEPTLGLDDEYTKRLTTILTDRAAKGAGMMIVTHSNSLLKDCDTIAVLADGKLQAVGTPEVLSAKYLAEFRIEVDVAGSGITPAAMTNIAPKVLIEQMNRMIAFGDSHLVERFHRLAEDMACNSYQVRKSELADLYTVAAGFTKQVTV